MSFKKALGELHYVDHQKLFSKFNLIDILKFKGIKMDFHELEDNFLKPILKIRFNGLSLEELWVKSCDRAILVQKHENNCFEVLNPNG